jgi:putative DNA primase/helicase
VSLAAGLVQRLGGRMNGRYGLARCPAHDDRNPSLSIADGTGGALRVHCFAGCSKAAVIEALQQIGLWPQRAGDPILTDAERQRHLNQEAKRKREQARRKAFVARLWRETWNIAHPARGSPVEQWLRHRGIDAARLDLDRLPLRWSSRSPRGKDVMPAMLALMTEPLACQPCGIHRSFLFPDGRGKASVEPVRQMLGSAGIIRLSPDDEVELGLHICEGIETGLSIMASGWRPVWACGSLTALRGFPVLAGIQALTIFADPKPHEVAGARACAARWATAGREVNVYIPREGGDFNDILGVTG